MCDHDDMNKKYLLSIPADVLAELEQIARQRSVNEVERVTVATILREGAALAIKEWNDEMDR